MIDVKDVLTTEELVTSVTDGDCLRLEESSVAVEARNAMFVWPHERHGDANADSPGLVDYMRLYLRGRLEHNVVC